MTWNKTIKMQHLFLALFSFTAPKINGSHLHYLATHYSNYWFARNFKLPHNKTKETQNKISPWLKTKSVKNIQSFKIRFLLVRRENFFQKDISMVESYRLHINTLSTKLL